MKTLPNRSTLDPLQTAPSKIDMVERQGKGCSFSSARQFSSGHQKAHNQEDKRRLDRKMLSILGPHTMRSTGVEQKGCCKVHLTPSGARLEHKQRQAQEKILKAPVCVATSSRAQKKRKVSWEDAKGGKWKQEGKLHGSIPWIIITSVTSKF